MCILCTSSSQFQSYYEILRYYIIIKQLNNTFTIIYIYKYK